MESLLPSEIARLVYGYLMEEKCDAAAQMFLETSGPLQECNLALKKGRKFSTRILGLSLLDILNIYTDAVCMLRNYKEKKASGNDSTNEQRDSASLNIELNNVIQELESVLLAGEHPEKNTPKTIFVRISIPRNFSGQGLCAVPLSTSSLAGNSHLCIRGRKTTSAHFPHYLLCSPLLRKVSSSDNKSDKKETEKKEAERKEKEKEKSQNQGGGDECFENTTVSKNVSSSLDDFDLNMLQTLLDNTALHERIAENINKAIDSSGEINTSETNEKKIVETVLHSTEADPIFEELLHMLAVPRAEDTTTPEDTDKEGGDPVEERPRPAHQVTPQALHSHVKRHYLTSKNPRCVTGMKSVASDIVANKGKKIADCIGYLKKESLIEGSEVEEIEVAVFHLNSSNFEDLCSANKSIQKKVTLEELLAAPMQRFLESRINDQESPHLLFFKSLLPDIEKLTQKRQRKFRKKLLELVNNLVDEEEDD